MRQGLPGRWECSAGREADNCGTSFGSLQRVNRFDGRCAACLAPAAHQDRIEQMKIEGPNPLRGGAIRKSKVGKAAEKGGFAGAMDVTDDTVPSPSGVTGAGPIQSVDSLLALQGSDDDADRLGRARARGEALLDRLDMLRTDILEGRIPRQRLDELGSLVRSQRAVVDDPRLTGVLDEIELRVEVELAKLATDR